MSEWGKAPGNGRILTWSRGNDPWHPAHAKIPKSQCRTNQSPGGSCPAKSAENDHTTLTAWVTTAGSEPVDASVNLWSGSNARPQSADDKPIFANDQSVRNRTGYRSSSANTGLVEAVGGTQPRRMGMQQRSMRDPGMRYKDRGDDRRPWWQRGEPKNESQNDTN